jgi:aldehyde dehydrogenase (NAD+)
MPRTDVLHQLGIAPINDGACAGAPTVGGAWRSDPNSYLIESENPSNGHLLARVRAAVEADYDAVALAAQTAFHRWRTVPAPKRGELVRRMAELLRENKDALGRLIALENGKIRSEGDGEVQEMIDIAEFAVGQSRMLHGLSMHSERPQHRMYEQWHPLGVVGIITAFNFPVAVWAWNAFIAAVCGDVVIWKPSSKVPLCAIAVQHLCNRAMAELNQPGVFSLFITDDAGLAERLVCDRQVPLVSFTGSTPVGRRVATLVAERLGRSLLELGGNNAIVVDETADLDLALPAILFGAVGTAGQRCTSTRRLIVHEARADELMQRLVNAYHQIRIGDPLDSHTLMGPLIDSAAVEAYREAIAEIADAGGEIVCGGRVLEHKGHFVEPTIVRVKKPLPIMQRETFAPILYVMTYRDLDEAIAMHNDVPQGLSSAIFTLNMRNVERFLAVSGSDCGIANVNIGTSGAEIGGAFGGEKETGGGREAGSDAWKAYMRRQTNTINWGTELPLAQGVKFDLG